MSCPFDVYYFRILSQSRNSVLRIFLHDHQIFQFIGL